MGILPYGLGGTRYGVRLGSNASQDPSSSIFAVGMNPNWGQGPSPFYDADAGLTGNHWTAIPYLHLNNPVLFDAKGSQTAITVNTSFTYNPWNIKMTSPQDIIIPKASAVDTSKQHQMSAFYGLGSYGAVGATLTSPSFGVNISTMMIDVDVECMLAGIDHNAYKTVLNQNGNNPSSAVSAIPTAYTPLNPGCWITAMEMFSNSSIYAYVGARDDDDTVLGVVPYVNCSLAKLTYSFAAGAGLSRSFSLISPWSVEFTQAAIAGWYAYSPRMRLTTPGLQLANTLFGSGFTADYNYISGNANGGEFMAYYAGATAYAVKASSASVSGAAMIYQQPAVNTPGGWGFIPPASWTILGTPVGAANPVYMPSMGVGRDCFLDFAFYNGNSGAWEWASYWLNSNSTYWTGSVGSTIGPAMQAVTASSTWPGGLVRLQGFQVSASSRASLIDEMGNRAMVGSVSQPPMVSGSFSVVETDVGLWTQFFQSQMIPALAYDNTLTSGQPAAATTSLNGIYMSDPGTPMRVNAVMTVATPGAMRLAMLRFVCPNIRVSSAGRRVVVNGVGSRQYSWTCEDGGVASGSSLISISNYAAQGNLGLNAASITPDGYGLAMGNGGGSNQTGGMCVQSFFVSGN